MKKKNILTIALSLCLAAVIAVGATLAYFTDSTNAKTNTFTMGKVKIDLTDTTEETENVTPGQDGIEYVKVMPGDTLSKIVTVTKDTDSADCYVAVLVEAVPGGSGYPSSNELLGYVDDSVDQNWTVRYLKDGENGSKVAATGVGQENGVPADAKYALYVYNTALTDASASQTLFTSITFPGADWGNDYAEATFSLKVTGYAVQQENFPTADEMHPELTAQEVVANWFAGNLGAIEADDLDNVAAGTGDVSEGENA